VTPESLREALDGGVGHAVLAGDLAMAGAVHLGVKDGCQEIGPA
jgi:hypothetical protein